LSDAFKSSRWTIVTLLAMSALPFMQATILAPALSAISQSFHSNPNATFLVRLLLVAPSAAIILSAAGVGFVIDRTSKKLSLAIALVLYAACGIVAFLSETLELITATRFILGFSLSVLITATTALVGDYFAGAERESILGWQNALRGFANTAFPIVGALIGILNWRLIFLVNLVSLLLIWPTLRLPPPAYAQSSSHAEFSYKSVWKIYFLAFLGFLILYLLTLQIAFHLSAVGTTSPIWPGVALGIAALSAATCSTQYKRLRRRLSFVNIAVLAYVLMSLGYGLIGASTNLAVIAVGLVLAGLGFGMNTPNCSAWLLTEAPAGARGRALGGLTSAIFLGQIVSPFVYEPIVRHLGSAGAFLAVGIVSLLVAVVMQSLSGRMATATNA
jgi:MFS family permease